MEPNEMSNEELIFKYFYSGCDNAGEHATMAVEIQNRLRTSMHWLPMTDDAVFEDGKAYLVAMTMYEGSTRIDRIVYAEGSFWINDEEYETVHFSHYARITEPK